MGTTLSYFMQDGSVGSVKSSENAEESVNSSQKKEQNLLQKDNSNTEDIYCEIPTDVHKMQMVENSGRLFITDAIETSIASGVVYRKPLTCKMTPETVREIETELAFYEKVSLVFLLYDNEDVALQWILQESSNNELHQSVNLLHEWAFSQKKRSDNDNWKLKFLEALCIIQNYQMLERLGYKKRDMQNRFIPMNTSKSLYVSLYRKVLYNISDNLGIKNTRIFLSYLKEAFRHKSIPFENYNINHLELYILHCLSMKFITKTDFTNLIKIFNEMKLLDISKSLMYITNKEAVRFVNNETNTAENCVPSVKEELRNGKPLYFDLNGAVNNVNVQDRVSPTQSNISNSSNFSFRSIYTDDEVYPIDSQNVGLCLIINQENFYPCEDPKIKGFMRSPKPLKERTGTHFDRDKLHLTFKKLGFKVKAFNDRKHSEIIDDIKQTLSQFSKKDCCFVLCILSHGENGVVYGSDSVRVEVDDVINLLYESKILLGKPKVLIIQSCQGSILQTAYNQDDDLTTDGPDLTQLTEIKPNISQKLIPSKSDMLICWSTVSGFASIRNKNEGTWYIQELCDTILRDCNKTHLADILITVIDKVKQKFISTKEGNFCVVPKYETSQSKRIFLPIVHEDLENEDSLMQDIFTKG